ncbi:hypothetical protein AB0J83_25115 [Actinoplanes sp. NPDC049596]|uniref:hypothetical protein n=1 Tax=unclassified Actinoplanes TaxID=2626549 RepID=UPI003440FB43
MTAVAANNHGRIFWSGISIDDTSQKKNVVSNPNASTVIASVVSGRRRASRRIRTRFSGPAAGPASTL